MLDTREYGNEANVQTNEDRKRERRRNQSVAYDCVYLLSQRFVPFACSSTLLYVTRSRCVYVFQLWDVRSKIVVVASLCIRLCRCWSLDIIWRHIILCYFWRVLVLVCPFSALCMYLCCCCCSAHTRSSSLFHTVIVHKRERASALCVRKTLPDIRIGCYTHITHFILNKYCFFSWVSRSRARFSWCFMCGIALQAGYITRIVFFLHKTTTHRTSIWLGSQFDFFSTQFSEYFDSKFIFLLVFFDEFRTFRYHSFQLFARMNLFISIFFPGCYSVPETESNERDFFKGFLPFYT